MNIQEFLDLDKNHRIRVAVVGDCLIDEYFSVSANRVSPEFPIPVMQTNCDAVPLQLPGGAANVCSQFKFFNVDVDFFSAIDYRAMKVLSAASINPKYCQLMPNAGTIPRKRRLYNGEFPLCRWDIESPDFGLDHDNLIATRKGVFEAYQQSPSADVVVFSDYNKGMFTNESVCGLDWLHPKNRKVVSIVDPKKGPLSKWVGCSIFKPNSKEAADLSGETDWKLQADMFSRNLSCNAVVITQGGDGVVGKVAGKYFEYRPKHNLSAESVIGAGDCFVAFLAMATARRINLEDAVELAWKAGSTYVQRRHNRPVYPHELLGPIESKWVSQDFLKDRDFPITWTNGCFDLVHAGHLGILEYCKSIGHKLVVGVNSDASISKLKGSSRPILPLKHRMEMLAALQYVDYIIPFDSDTPYDIIKSIKPEVLVKGGDYQADKVIGADVVKDIRIFPLVEGISTSNIVEKIKKAG